MYIQENLQKYFVFKLESLNQFLINEPFKSIKSLDYIHNTTFSIGPRKFTFPSHQLHMLTLAKMCQDNSDYTDCVIQCGDFSPDDGEGEHERNR